MKITHVLSGLTKGGGERVTVELANCAILENNIVTILAGWPEDRTLLQSKIHNGIDIKFISSKKKFAYLKTIFWIINNRKLIRTQDILHCHLTFGYTFGYVTNLILKKILRYKTPVIIETNHAVGMPVPVFKRWLHAHMASKLNGMVLMAKDPYWNNFILRNPCIKTEVIPNGISIIETIKNGSQKNKLLEKIGVTQNNKYVVGTVSLLRPERKPVMYVSLFYEIYKILGDHVHFVLGGEGTEQINIEKFVNKKKLSANFHLIGMVDEPAEIISGMDIYVSISVGETGGISMLEAALCKVPVVSIQLFEGYEAKKEDWVWSHNSVPEVAKKIIILLQHPEERKRIQQDQYKHVKENFTSEVMFKSYDAFYKNLLSENNEYSNKRG